MSDPHDRLASALSDRYRIERELGAGGMATVYLAADLKHDRKVALKVLKPELAAVVGSERFLAEIRTTANLQHPHILPLFDSGEADGFLFFVMPYVDGESLRDRLDREKHLPVDEAVRIATEVADALAHAHAKGVIHRDIKPANILLRDGRVQVADFGIALAVQQAGGARLTETGLSVGTPHYMSPEQAAGDRQLDGRSDVYSLGCVLYEMLAGEPPHVGPTAQAILAKILTEEPRSLAQLRRSVPPHVEVAVHTALEKLPADRFASAADLRRLLSEPSAAADLIASVSTSRKDATRSGRHRMHSGLAGWGVALALAALYLFSDPSGPAPAVPLLDVDVLLPDSAPLVFRGEADLQAMTSLALSPDGASLAYVGRIGGRSRILVRSLDRREEAGALPGTEGAHGLSFSPDGEWISFFAGGELKKVAVGRPVLSLARVTSAGGAAWAPDGSRILVSVDEGLNMVWVPSSGGSSQPIGDTPLGAWSPDFLPDGRHVLAVSGLDQALTILDLVTLERRLVTVRGLLPPGSVEEADHLTARQPRYVPSGHIVYLGRDATLMALPFDVEGLRVLGAPVPVLSGLRLEVDGVGHFDFSDGGTLVYAPGHSAAVAPFVWLDLKSRSSDTLPFPPREWGGFALSSDGQRLLAQAASGPLYTLLDLDPVAGTETVVPSTGRNFNPWWWPDEEAAVYFERQDDEYGSGPTFRQRLGSLQDRDTLTADGNVSDVSPDGRWLAVSQKKSAPGIWLQPTEDGHEPVLIDASPMSVGGAFSPDGRWLAYWSPEAGVIDIYAVALPLKPGDRRIKVSQGGGVQPVWSAQGDLVYSVRQRILRVAPPSPGRTSFGTPEILFEGPFVTLPYRSHALSPDGRRLLLVLGSDVDTAGHVRVVTDWFAQLKRLAPRSGR